MAPSQESIEQYNFYPRFGVVPCFYHVQHHWLERLQCVTKVHKVPFIREITRTKSIPPLAAKLCPEKFGPVLSDMFTMSLSDSGFKRGCFAPGFEQCQ